MKITVKAFAKKCGVSRNRINYLIMKGYITTIDTLGVIRKEIDTKVYPIKEWKKKSTNKKVMNGQTIL